MYLSLPFSDVEQFAGYILNSDPGAGIIAHIRQTIVWCYIFYALSTQLATNLLAISPRWYLYQSLVSNIYYVLSWAIVCQVGNLDINAAWTYHSFATRRSLVFSFFDILLFVEE